MRKMLVSLVVLAMTVPLVAVFAEKNPPVSKTFTIGTNTVIAVGDNKAAKLADLKVGDKVGIAYHENGATLAADHVRVMIEQPKPAESPKAPGERAHNGPKKDDTELHVRGAITAIDTTANTVTVEVKEHHKRPADAPAAAPAAN